MSGITNRAFRKICTMWGAEFSFTEMISAESVLRNFKVVEKMLPKDEINVAVQLFGNDPFKMAQAAQIVEPYAKWIDINAACPVKKVIKKGSGGALLRDLQRLERIIQSVKTAVKVPVTVKVRVGFEENELDAILNTCIKAGADAVEVHGRTVVQQYSGEAYWDLKLSKYTLPTAISGDIYEPEDVREAIERSGAQAVLIARGALRKPWIFAQIVQGRTPSVPEIEQMFLKHLKMQVEEEGERSVYKMRQFVAGYTHGIKGAREFRERFTKANTESQAREMIEEFFNTFLMNGCNNEVVEWIEDSQSRRCCT
ncbi:tRNA dihydrouridine synthase [Pseudothermotoga sp. U03pept]|uniref:tRNA dihydrouridine synthase n=1 Tax=Pseudothermotoga sp. U03pept TaxID=3447012 RepID=UPI003EFCBA1C